jgi:hypothetical protein
MLLNPKHDNQCSLPKFYLFISKLRDVRGSQAVASRYPALRYLAPLQHVKLILSTVSLSITTMHVSSLNIFENFFDGILFV